MPRVCLQCRARQAPCRRQRAWRSGDAVRRTPTTRRAARASLPARASWQGAALPARPSIVKTDRPRSRSSSYLSHNPLQCQARGGCARMRTSTSVLVILLSIVIAMPRIQAQSQAPASHTASQSAIDAALQQHVSSAAADRADLLRVLANPEVKAVAEKAGLDLRRATTAVASLEGQELTQLAAQARQVDQALAGGQSKIVISTTMIIIALLVLILIIVAVD